MNFSDEMTAEQRQIAERSVAAFAARSIEVAAQKRAARASQAELAAALNKPLRRIIESDPDAAAALATARQRHQERSQPPEQPFDLEPPAWPVIAHEFSLDLAGVLVGGVADQIFPIPYHYDWRWHAGAEPVRNSADRATGQVSIAVDSPVGGFCHAHAGVGVSLRTDREMTVSGRSLRSSWEKGSASTGTGGSAVTHGGMEMTVFEDGVLRGFVPDTRWAFEASYSQTDLDTGGFGTGGSVQLTWPMHPGRDYAFNVGGWVECSLHRGEGEVADVARGEINAKVILLSLFHQ